MGPDDRLADIAARARRRRIIRSLAAAASVATALLYLGIGIGALSVVDETASDAPPLLIFGLSAATAFAVGAILLVAYDRRILWVLGALLQVGVIVMYIQVAPQRTPPFELWGITIKVLQVLILAALSYLAVRPQVPAAERGPRGVTA